MILNISGRTDIVAFYLEWLMNRFQEGYVDVRNPFNSKLVSRIYFENVDLLVFCTKNPLPILKYLDEIRIPFLFQVTITPYHEDVEPNVIDKKKIVEAVKVISNKIGSDKVFVRYDPIFLSEKYSLDYHIKAFDRLCSLLNGVVHKIIVSFIDDYQNVRKNEKTLKFRSFTERDYQEIGKNFSKSAKNNGIVVQTCFEERNLVEYGFVKGECLSHELAYRLTGKRYPNWTARKEGKCQCVRMIDIGVYDSCSHFCKYCYANYDERKVKNNIKKHLPSSSLLIGKLEDDDVIKVRYC